VTYRVAVAVSGRGSNLEALCEALAGDPNVAVVLVVSERAAPGLDVATARGIATHRWANHADPEEWLRVLAEADVDLLVLAGYLKLVPAEVTAALAGRIINIHPALLPKHGGPGMYGHRVHAAVLAAGDAISGATVHLVDADYDRGAILAQGSVPVLPEDDVASLAARVLTMEHRLLPAAVRAAALAGHPVPFDFT
jgi:phosphoribosylglycinamide formyltransferase 1